VEVEMSARVIGIVAAAMAAVAGAAGAQDAATVDKQHCRVIVDNAYVRVLEFTLAPGEKDPVHTHAAGVYVVTSTGKMRVTPTGAAASTWEPKPSETAWMEAEGPPGSENVGTTPMSFVLVEVKAAAKKGAASK
jgi:quercetin dioxygenase-like cupin family protein